MPARKQLFFLFFFYLNVVLLLLWQQQCWASPTLSLNSHFYRSTDQQYLMKRIMRDTSKETTTDAKSTVTWLDGANLVLLKYAVSASRYNHVFVCGLPKHLSHESSFESLVISTALLAYLRRLSHKSCWK